MGDDIETTIKEGHGEVIRSDPDPLEAYAFDIGDAFVRWVPWGDDRADKDVWVIINASWAFRQKWIEGRDDMPMRRHHRRYTLLSKELWEERDVSEHILQTGSWKRYDQEAEEVLVDE